MSTKSRYIAPQQAARVAVALRRAGYAATSEDCVGYAINVARRIDPADERRVHQVIDLALDGWYLDDEGYRAYEIGVAR